MVNLDMVYKPAIKNNFAFTLVELLIAVSVMLILTAVTVMLLNPTKLRSDANETKALSELGTVTNAMEFYFNDKHSYPLKLNDTVNHLGLIEEGYLTDVNLLTDDAGDNYCYLRITDGTTVSSYKICTKSTKTTSPLLSTVNPSSTYDATECSYTGDPQVQCLQSPF